MKKLKVFKDFEKDIFFAPALGNSVTRFDPVDRAKCFYWERERTLCFTYPEIGEVFNSSKIICCLGFFILVSFGFIGYRRLTIGLSQETKNLLQLFEKNFRKTKIS